MKKKKDPKIPKKHSKKEGKNMVKKTESIEESFFLDTFNVDSIFKNMDRRDYLILYYINLYSDSIQRDGRIYLADLADAAQITIPELSDAIERLNDKGFLSWETDIERGNTYVILTNKAVELMTAELQRMKNGYALIRKEIGDEEFERTLKTLKKIGNILRRAGEEKE